MSADMDLQLDATADQDAHCGGSIECGRHHVLVTAIDATMNEFSSIVVSFQVLASEAQGQAGKSFREFLSPTPKAAVRIKRFCMVCGILDPGQSKSLNEIAWQDAVGKDLVVRVVDNEYTNRDGDKKTTKQVGFLDFWRTDHAEVSAVPKGEIPSPKKPKFEL